MNHHKSSYNSIAGCFWEPNMQKDRELVDKEAGTLRVFQQCLVGSKCLQKSSCAGWVVQVYIWAMPLPVPIDQHDSHGLLLESTTAEDTC